MPNPFFSVIIPAYNPGAYLEQTIQSVMLQSFSDWELLVIDDGSRPDEAQAIRRTVETAQRLFASDVAGDVAGDKIRFYCQKNQGVSATRNFGMQEARGKWLAFLDNDDLWKPTMLERQCAILSENPDVGFSHTAFDIIDEKGDFANEGYGAPADYLQCLSGNHPVLPCNCVMSKAAAMRVGGFDPFYPMAQDLDLSLKIQAYYRVIYLAENLASYRVHSNNVSKSYRNSHCEAIHILRKHEMYGLYKSRPEVVAAARQGIHFYNSIFSMKGFEESRVQLKQHDWRAFLSHLSYAFRLHPAFVAKKIKKIVLNKISRSTNSN